MCVSKEQGRKPRTLTPPVLPLPPLGERFRFLRLLTQERDNTRIELYEDLVQGCKVVGKRMLRTWTLNSPKEFADANPELLESPWQELELSLSLGGRMAQGVCRSFGAFEDHDIILFMEYVRGGDFHDLAKRCSTEPGSAREEQAWPLILSLLNAVRGLHDRGVAHGDISLENALLGEDAEVRLVDFAAAVMGPAQGVRGKPSYQAPEMHQAGAGSYDAKAADLFACGVFIYALLIADYPWKSTRPGTCSAFDFYSSQGLQAFLAQRRIRFNGCKGPPVATALSPRMTHLLSILLSPSPSKRERIWQELPNSAVPEIREIEDCGVRLTLKVK
ncbi:unnamed protein product [Effrenium voratum]|uniref:non-specific serine/threonine protein kinase n=1 Tax=Effrenium voratum TaxID=2562239 RepID=A0AA36I8Z9_9DINO|nr:unnamed protein product [Effrenium voratum]CAJ1430883.1 unnamed protein product [Effrenium voratum]